MSFSTDLIVMLCSHVWLARQHQSCTAMHCALLWLFQWPLSLRVPTQKGCLIICVQQACLPPASQYLMGWKAYCTYMWHKTWLSMCFNDNDIYGPSGFSLWLELKQILDFLTSCIFITFLRGTQLKLIVVISFNALFMNFWIKQCRKMKESKSPLKCFIYFWKP